MPAGARRALLVPTAAVPLREPAIAAPVRRELERAGLEVRELDVDGVAPERVRGAVAACDLVAVSGGDPFHLLRAARAAGLAEAVRAAGVPYVGVSAGAMVAGPTLEPARLTSPLPAPPPGTDLRGLGLTDVLVLPHHGRPGRAERHDAALEAHAAAVRLVPLRDGEAVHVDPAGEQHLTRPDRRSRDSPLTGGQGMDPAREAGEPSRSDRTDARRRDPGDGSLGLTVVVRAALASDAAPVAGVLAAAGRAGWGGVLDVGALAQDPVPWRERIAAAGPPARFLVADDGVGVVAFVLVRGDEVELLHAHPNAWGTGVASRLLRIATAGLASVRLRTEERNARALAFYAREGFRPDGTAQERDRHGQRLREVRLRRS